MARNVGWFNQQSYKALFIYLSVGINTHTHNIDAKDVSLHLDIYLWIVIRCSDFPSSNLGGRRHLWTDLLGKRCGSAWPSKHRLAQPLWVVQDHDFSPGARCHVSFCHSTAVVVGPWAMGDLNNWTCNSCGGLLADKRHDNNFWRGKFPASFVAFFGACHNVISILHLAP